MQINFNIPTISILLFAIAFVCLLYILIVCGRKLYLVRHRRRLCDASATDDAQQLPRASVVVYANEDANLLENTLPQILNQQYPGQFEVIVVNDGSQFEINALVNRLKTQYDNLRLTFTPDSSRNISPKKLAITLGVKAAKGDVTVITDAATMVNSDRWLEDMMRPFVDPQVEVVIGYGTPLFSANGHVGRIVKYFDTMADDVAWLSTAIGGKPYRASGNNIAYRRDTFFRNKGFKSSLNMRNGDDDLFVNEIAFRDNTVVQLSADAMTQWGAEGDMSKRLRRHRQTHAFTGRQLPKISRGLLAAGDWMIWGILLCSLAGGFFAGITNMVGWGIAALLIIITMVAVILMWRSTIVSLGGPKLCLTLPFMAATRPLRNLISNTSAGAWKNANYTWQKLK